MWSAWNLELSRRASRCTRGRNSIGIEEGRLVSHPQPGNASLGRRLGRLNHNSWRRRRMLQDSLRFGGWDRSC